MTGRNLTATLKGEPWADYLARHDGDGISAETAAEEALAWLCRAQDHAGLGGVPSYEFYGWSSGYPEVTGYIIPTFWDYHRLTGRPELAERAVRMAEWELRIQKPVGGWEGLYEGAGQPPIVFNTGQVIRGLLRTHEETGEQRFLDAAVRAGDWIVANQEPDGSWARANFRGLKRVYDSYVSAPLARLSPATGRDEYAASARRNCEFALEHQQGNGWFELCDNSEHFPDAPNTHTLCYTADGLLETGELLREESFIDAARLTADGLRARVDSGGRLPGRLGPDWSPRVKWVCLPGSAQLGILLARLYDRGGDQRYLETSGRLLDFLVFAQRLNAVGSERRGAVAGAFPIWGLHAPFTYPCWAAKYFLDHALLLRQAKGAVEAAQAV